MGAGPYNDGPGVHTAHHDGRGNVFPAEVYRSGGGRPGTGKDDAFHARIVHVYVLEIPGGPCALLAYEQYPRAAAVCFLCKQRKKKQGACGAIIET